MGRGQRRIDPAQLPLPRLLAAIHRVNPTERGCPPGEEAARYREKARLQSALVRRFPDVVCASLGRDPNIVALDLRAGGDAGHARLDALDADARAWVRRQLDLGAEPLAPTWSPPPAAESAPDPLQAGLEALEAFDYPLAEGWLQAALPHPAAGRALLELYVDCLADDAGALALWAAHRPALATDPEARTLVAVAASRQGARAVAVEALAGLSGARAAKAWVRLGHGALSADHVRRAEADRRAAAEADPALPALAALDRALAEHAATARAPLEAQLSAALATGEVGAIEAAAEALKAEHPSSEAAGQALAQVAARRRIEARAAAVDEARQAEAAGAWGQAVTAWRQAVRLGAPEADLLTAEAQLAAQDRAARRAAVAARLALGVDEGALLAWWALPEADRLGLADRPELGWLAALAPPGRGSQAKAAARAVLALAEAPADPLEAVAALRVHERALAGLPAWLALLDAARAAEAHARTAEVTAGLDAAEAEAQGGDTANALARIAALSLGDLPAEDRAALEARRDVLRHRCEAAALTAEADRRVARDDLLGARAVVARRLAMDPEDLSWRARLAAVDVAVAKAWHYTVLHPHEPCGLPELVALPADPALRGLTPDGRLAVVASAWGPWLFLRWLAMGDPAVVVRAVVLRAPTAGPVRDLVVDAAGRVALAVGDGADLLLVDALGSRPLDHVALWAGGADALEEVRLLPGGACAWVGEAAGGRGALSVIEPGGRTLRTFARMPTVVAVVGAPGAGRVALGDGQTVHLHEATGRRIGTWRFDAPVHGVAGWGADGVVVLTDGPQGARLHAVAPGRRPRPVDLPGAPGRAHGLATGGDALFVHLVEGEARVLTAIAGDDDQLQVRWRRLIDSGAHLVVDPGGTRVALLTIREGPAALTQLALTSPPELAPPRARPAGLVRSPWGLTPCAGLSVRRRARVEAMVKLLRARSTPARRRWIRDQIATEMGEDEAVELFHATRRVSFQLGSEVAEHALARYPASAQVRLLVADRAARLGNWAKVGSLLSAAAPPAPEADYAAHFHHLLGLSLLFSGAPQSAQAAWAAGAACAGAEACGLVGLRRSVDADDDAALSVFGYLVRALHRADAARAAGDFEAVIDWLDHPYTWRQAELQSVARLTEAHLETPARTDAAWLRKARTVTAFLALTEPGAAVPDWMTLQLPATRWAPDRIAELRARARLWLSPAPESQ